MSIGSVAGSAPAAAGLRDQTLATDLPDAALDAIAGRVWGTSTRTITAFGFNVTLSPTGLDQIPVDPPARGATPLFRHLVSLTWRRWFRKATYDGTTLTGYADDGTTPLFAQPLGASGANQSQGPAQ